MRPFRPAIPATGFVNRRSLKRNIHNEKAHTLDLGSIFVSSDGSDRQDGRRALSDLQPLRLGSLIAVH
jgi:hypothetical protein